jgi:hypothetical protein
MCSPVCKCFFFGFIQAGPHPFLSCAFGCVFCSCFMTSCTTGHPSKLLEPFLRIVQIFSVKLLIRSHKRLAQICFQFLKSIILERQELTWEWELVLIPLSVGLDLLGKAKVIPYKVKSRVLVFACQMSSCDGNLLTFTHVSDNSELSQRWNSGNELESVRAPPLAVWGNACKRMLPEATQGSRRELSSSSRCCHYIIL